MTYRAPIDDIIFTMEAVVGDGALADLPGFADCPSDVTAAILAEAGRFATGVLAPLNRVGDRQGCRLENGVVRTSDGFAEAYRLFAENGWNGLDLSPPHGGQGLPRLLAMAVAEMWNAANMAFALCPMLTQSGARLLDRFGTDQQKRLYLARLVSGAWTSTMTLTEPQAGSDLSRIRTRAVRHEGHYRITGQKIFISYGDHDWADNIIHFVLARLPDAPAGIDGISLFLVPKFLVEESGRPGERNDVHCLSLEHKLGIHASPTAVMGYGEDAAGGGAVGYLIGAENQGLRTMFAMMNDARLAVGVEGVGLAEGAFQLARDYARERVQGLDSPIIDHPDVRRMLLSMKARTEAARAIAYFVAAQADAARVLDGTAAGEAARAMVDLLTPVSKAWNTDMAIAVADTGIQVHGGAGFIEESGAPQFLRDARVTAIYEGTNGIQARDLASRKVRRDGGRAARTLLDRMRADPDGSPAAAAVALLDDATQWMTGQEDEAAALAAATPYLRLAGLAIGGWLMARSGAAARRRRDSGEEHSAAMRARMASSRFYLDNLLPEAAFCHAQVVGGAPSVLAPASADI